MATQETTEHEGWYPPLGKWLAVRAYPSSEGVAVYFQDITERKHAEEILRKSDARQAFLLTLSDTLRPLADPTEIQSAVTNVLGSYLKGQRALYAEVESDETTIIVRANYTDGLPSVVGVHSFNSFGTFVIDAFRAGRTLVVEDIEKIAKQTPEQLAATATVGIRAFLAVPLVKNGRLTAFLTLNASTPRPWSSDEVALVEETAERTWAAVERARAEECVRESETRFRTMAEALPALVWIARPDGFFDYYNQRWYDYTGLTAEQLAGWGWMKVWHPEDLPDGRAHWLESLRTGQPYEHEARLRCAADGSFRWHLIRAVPLHAPEGRVLRWLGTNTDIEERKRMEEALQESIEELRRFNRAAVGRELRMIELKKEINALCLRQGEAKRYPLDFEQDGEEPCG